MMNRSRAKSSNEPCVVRFPTLIIHKLRTCIPAARGTPRALLAATVVTVPSSIERINAIVHGRLTAVYRRSTNANGLIDARRCLRTNDGRARAPRGDGRLRYGVAG